MTEGPAEVLGLQRTIGNRATRQLLSGAGVQGSAPGAAVQRKCASCAAGNGKCPKCEEEERQVQRKAGEGGASASPGSVASAVHQGLQSPAQALEPHTKEFMESRFGQDFSHVRVHSDTQASESARQLDSLAYTVGNDIVFGASQYAPHSQEGQRLLAHELTHTVQQGGASHVAFDEIGVSESGDAAEQEADGAANAVVRGGSVTAQPTGAMRVARQQKPPAQQQAPQPPPVAAPTWAGCDPKEIPNLTGELSEAVAWVQEAIDNLEAKEGIPTHTSNALSRYLTTDSSAVKTTIVPKLKAILADLQLGPKHFRCQTEQQCLAVFPGGAAAYSGDPITLCPKYFDNATIGRVTDLIHEAGHNAGLGGNVIEWQWPFPGLSEKERLGNTESYAAFVRSNKYSSLAPYQRDVGFSLGAGALFPGGTGITPRFMVRVDFDPLLKQRIFHFLDLHLGLGVDVDSKGSVLGRFSLGARAFAPLSLTTVPAYLNLRVGGVAGAIGESNNQYRLGADQVFNVAGVSTEAGLGIQGGRLGASVNYMHVFNFLNHNPDINAVVVNAELRFP